MSFRNRIFSNLSYFFFPFRRWGRKRGHRLGRTAKCFNCKTLLQDSLGARCGFCYWIRCPRCGACGCSAGTKPQRKKWG